MTVRDPKCITVCVCLTDKQTKKMRKLAETWNVTPAEAASRLLANALYEIR